MNRFIILLTCTAGAGLTIAACGGVGGNLFGSGGAGGAGSTTSGHGATTGTASTGTGNAGGGATTGTTATTGTAATTGTTATTGTASTTSATTTATTSSGLPAPHVYCDSTLCPVGQICCFSPTDPGDHCGDPGSCEQGFVELSCDTPEACPGEVCCADVQFDQQGTPVITGGISCQPTCDGQDQITLCSATMNDTCPDNTNCTNDNMQNGFLGQNYYLCVPN